MVGSNAEQVPGKGLKPLTCAELMAHVVPQGRGWRGSGLIPIVPGYDEDTAAEIREKTRGVRSEADSTVLRVLAEDDGPNNSAPNSQKAA